MLRRFFGSLVVLVMLAGIVLPTTSALAAPPDPGSFLNASGVPAGSVLCLNITYKVTNDEDTKVSGGYWALDNYNKSVQVWQVPGGSFYAIARYEGKWNTFAGALSPQNDVPFTKDGSGTFHGGYIATFTADSCTSTFGNVGVYDFGGTQVSVLGGVDATPTLDWTSYFPGFASFNQTQWGWTYKYQNQTWNNFYSGNSGDIQF